MTTPQGGPSAPGWVPGVFLAPAILLLAVFLLYPLAETFRLSLVDWNGLGSSSRFVGLDNWAVLANDTRFWLALSNNLLLGLLSVLVQLPIALALAVMLDTASHGSRLLKILYFLPLLFSSVALGVIFKNLFDPNFGAINSTLESIGLKGLAVDWLGDPRFALGSVIAVVCWQNVPFYMILFMAGLASFPADLHAAAKLDGASDGTIFWRIKLPHLQGTIRTGAMLAVIGSLRYFDLIYGYTTVFASFRLGYGSTIAAAMFLAVALIAALGLRLTRRFETEV
jgi:raffinose/stachyose/melibiose transport system permease protein